MGDSRSRSLKAGDVLIEFSEFNELVGYTAITKVSEEVAIADNGAEFDKRLHMVAPQVYRAYIAHSDRTGTYFKYYSNQVTSKRMQAEADAAAERRELQRRVSAQLKEFSDEIERLRATHNKKLKPEVSVVLSKLYLREDVGIADLQALSRLLYIAQREQPVRLDIEFDIDTVERIKQLASAGTIQLFTISEINHVHIVFKPGAYAEACTLLYMQHLAFSDIKEVLERHDVGI